ALGHAITYGSRTPHSEAVQNLLQEQGATVSASSIAEAASRADAVLLATPHSALADILPELGTLTGKTVIDVTNALVMADTGLMQLLPDASGETIQVAKPEAKVVKAFNTIGFHVIANPQAAGGPVSVMLASDHPNAKTYAAELAEVLGFTSVDVGPIAHARYLEGMAALYMVPYLQGRMTEAFEFYLQQGAAPKESKGVRAAG
ncbi:MAG: NAD(P)-binding domain-containing protein, partial [Pseudomonadota bacterium]